ncbi:histidinol dehydrogenase [Microbacterium esteraromaticum]|uniref:histidinol dehydrogenase n=1 Tax=Microbacterium esteraromaticum TaxID=57043 RepID=UPI002368C75B|nr:histidinol dehydrogenase [Microbacterium esteraromaticum]WDH79757.1 histidinol dehydrogenase [Microbacterium esteraromaticum]
MRSIFSRGLSWLAAALVGAVYGVAATIAHSFMLGPVPVGMIVGAIGCAALLIALRALTGDRWAALAAGLGMMALILIISQRGPGGSVVVPNTPLGNIWMYVASGIVLLTVMWPDTSRLRALSSSMSTSTTPRTPES